MSIRVSATGHRDLGARPCCTTTLDVEDGVDWEAWKNSPAVKQVTLVNFREFGARYTWFKRGDETLIVTEAV